ncbi:MFS domain-containing protein [Caenorhabditis elegans]|uniref:MFS domain-containing protein n=1 Tax=Caenorhabditis elegans TaxID=6239 RepID=Q18935_CAEEL|nr:MFS domain-containing protein [Caenorhabditis elegans]CAA92292.2 MFS domain-containing protein [Caenorhabditis elegans]|eukprot:NP_501553.2 Uncharacterized protein CELE_D1046.4 [Caenorhabditis elegans]
MITADNLKTPIFSATRCTNDHLPAYKSFLHRTRFLLLLLVILLNATVYSNTILINFSVICMSEEKISTMFNGSHNDYEVLREAIATSMNDFRSIWFTFSSIKQSIMFMMSPLGSLLAMYPTWMLIMKFGYRRICSTTCLISTFLTAFLPWSIFFGFPYVATCQFLLGATAPSALLLVPSVIRKWSTRKNDHFCFLVLFTFQQISPAALYPIAAYISKTFVGWPVIFYFQSIFSCIVTTVFFYFYKETPIRHANVSDNELQKIQRNEAVRGNIDYKKMFLCHQFQSVCFSIFIYFMTFSFFVQYLPSYLYDIMEQSVEKTAWTVSLIIIVHLILKIFISRIFEKNPLLTNIYSIKFLQFSSFAGSAVIMITLFVTKFHFDIQLILYAAIFAFLSLTWPSVFKSSNIISNKYYLPVMVRIHVVLFYFGSFASNILPLVLGRNTESWNNWRWIWLVFAVLLIGSVILFWLTFQFEKSDWDIVIPVEPPQPPRPEDIAPVSHPRPCQFSTSFDDEIVVSIISRGLDRCDTCKKHGIDARIHPSNESEVIPTRKMFDELLQQNQEDTLTVTRF